MIEFLYDVEVHEATVAAPTINLPNRRAGKFSPICTTKMIPSRANGELRVASRCQRRAALGRPQVYDYLVDEIQLPTPPKGNAVGLRQQDRDCTTNSIFMACAAAGFRPIMLSAC
jgi:hypothetical protein